MSTAHHPSVHTIGVLYQQHSEGAVALAQRLLERFKAEGREGWSLPGRHEGELQERLSHTDLVIVLGGDGSLISAARACASLSVPLLGINFGRVGFLTELEPDEVDEKLPLYLEGNYWTDERSMLRGEVEGDPEGVEYLALNDIVMVRGAEPRIIRIKVWVDGHAYNTTVADGVIVSTATGSTAYNLAAGGPILHPQVRSNVLTPVAPHLVADRSLILEPGAVITLELQPGAETAILSADGQINREIPTNGRVKITTSSYVTRFLRRRSPTNFYRILSAKLRDNL